MYIEQTHLKFDTGTGNYRVTSTLKELENLSDSDSKSSTTVFQVIVPCTQLTSGPLRMRQSDCKGRKSDCRDRVATQEVDVCTCYQSSHWIDELVEYVKYHHKW